MELTVNRSKCPQNHKCPAMAVCPKGAISQANHFSLPVIDQDKCIACGKCIKFCPKGAFEFTGLPKVKNAAAADPSKIIP